MFKKAFALASLCAAILSPPLALAVTGGGAEIPARLYKGAPESILPQSFTYAVTGSGVGKQAFLNNDSAPFGTSGTVHYAGSDSVLTASELSNYNSYFRGSYGPLIQIPMAHIPIAIPYRRSGIASLNLTSWQLCSVFSGEAKTWGQLLSTTDAQPIKVVYRYTRSGATEILTRHLNSVCPHRISVNSDFISARLSPGGLPANWVGVATDQEVFDVLKNYDGSIGYVGPDLLGGAGLGDNSKVARVNATLPTFNNVNLAISGAFYLPSTATDRADPKKWVSVIANPQSGYSIVGSTNMIVGQCYKDSSVAKELLEFLARQYGGVANNAAMISHGFLPLTITWKTAVMNSFVTGNSENLNINNPNVCNGKGRP
ncbi:substrate-binding domain-containing protein [Pseudomonas aeruginosa]|uniref:substrate-binding domain-containing protein n=1 Tax=Pseudomonas aeruginosa TaxID=287 RepID=UPI0014957554|nr:substrate-binding domain-containing protein [Pseudomonas aeruginosa]NPT00660.1 protein disulfide reductase [Pseudomonas aeruginosa]